MMVATGVPKTSAAAAQQRDVVTWTTDDSHWHVDQVSVEEPLEIQLAGCSVSVTMRTPGDDFDLAAGFLFTEGILGDPKQIASIAYCGDGESQGNIVNVNPSDPELVDPERWRRNFFMTSSCGICGKASIEAVRQDAAPIRSEAVIKTEVLRTLDQKLREAQEAFTRTGGLHAAGLFDLAGDLLSIKEDVGRHNAVDKIVGEAFREGNLPLSERVLMVSGRASFEIMQKGLMAGVPIVAAVSAPSTLAVDLAKSGNMTLLGFLRSGRFNMYAGAARII